MKRILLGLGIAWAIFGTQSAAIAEPLSLAVTSLPELQWWASARRSTLAANPDGTGAVSENGPIGFISDLSGRGHNAVMGNSVVSSGDAFRPSYQSNFQRGMPAIVFDGVNDFASLGSSLVNGADSATIAFAIQGANSSLANARIWGASDGAQFAQLSFNSLGNPTVSAALQNNQPVAATDQGGYSFGGPYNSDYSMIVIARVRPGGSTDIWENGILRGSSSSPLAGGSVIRSVQKTLLGAANFSSNATDLTPAPGSWANFRFLEGFVTTSAISDAQVGDVYKYLSREWPGVQDLRGSPNLYWNSASNPERTVSTVDAGHLQGVAIGEASRFVFHTNLIERYDSKWNLQTNNQNVFAGTPTTYGPLRHVGDGDYFDGKLYAPLEADFGGNGYIGVYDATKPGLPLIGVRDISAQQHEVSSLVVVPEHGTHGIVYVTSFFSNLGGSKLWMYDFQDGNAASPHFGDFLGALTIPASVTNIQGVEYKAPFFYFSVSNSMERVAWTTLGLASTSEKVLRNSPTFQGLAIDGGSAFQAFQGGSTYDYIDELKNLDAKYISPWIAGDTNGDNRCGFADLNTLLTGYARPGTLEMGDFDQSGAIDFADLNILLTNYGRSATTNLFASVPEPGACGLVAVALACLMLRLVKNGLRLAVRVLVALAILCGFYSAAWATPIPINILPLGDSNTAASRGFYIAPLMNLLSANNYLVNYVANEGHSGYIIDGSLSSAPRPGLREHIGPSASPDFLDHAHVNEPNTYILLMIGTNDVDTGFQLSTSQVQSRMSGLIAAIHSEAPKSQLIVAKLPPILGKEAAIRKFNADIATTVSAPRVSLVDMNSIFPADATPYFVDRLHANQAGGNLMAPVWFAGIESALKLNRLPADTNLDDRVDFNDLLTVLTNFGKSGNFSMGDFDGSGNVDFRDLNLLLTSLGRSAPFSTSISAVPEPGTLALVAAAAVAVALARLFCRASRRNIEPAA